MDCTCRERGKKKEEEKAKEKEKENETKRTCEKDEKGDDNSNNKYDLQITKRFHLR